MSRMLCYFFYNWNPLLLQTHIKLHCVYIFLRSNGKIKSKPRCGITTRYSQKQHRIKEEFVCEYFSKTEKVQQYLLKQNNVNPCSIKFLFQGNYFWNTGRGWRKGGQLTKQEGPWSNWLPPRPPPNTHHVIDCRSGAHTSWHPHNVRKCINIVASSPIFFSTNSALHFYTEQTNSIAASALINTLCLKWKHLCRSVECRRSITLHKCNSISFVVHMI